MIALVRVASTANIAALSGLGTAVDGITLIAGNRVLVKNQNTPSQNGIYVADASTWTRATDTITAGLLCYVQEGTSNINQSYIVSTANPITVGSTSISFTLEPNINPLAAMGIAIGGATAVQDITAATISSNNLTFPDNANVILVGAGTINTVSNVKAGAVYQLIATGAVNITHNTSAINCGGANLSLAANDIVQILGLESNKVSIISAPHANSDHFDLDVNGNARITGTLNLGGTAGANNPSIVITPDGSNLTLSSAVGGTIRFEAVTASDPLIADARSWDMEVIGRGYFHHLLAIDSGEEGKFGKQADHAHFEQNVLSTIESLGGTTQLLRKAGNTNILALAGKSPKMGRDVYPPPATVAEHSIDTTATNPSSGVTRIKLRYTGEVSLPAGKLIQLDITSPVAGIQAAIYSGTVYQEPTLSSGLWEVLVDVNGFDSNHWDATYAENTSSNNTKWQLYTLKSNSLSGNESLTVNRSDEVIASFSTAHGLQLGEAVTLRVVSTPTGLSGLTVGTFYPGYVSKVTTNLQVAIVLSATQFPRPTLSGSTLVDDSYEIYRGIPDPSHYVVLGAQNWTFWRDEYGLTTRHQVGPLTEALATLSAAYGVDVRNETANSVEIGYGNFSKINISESRVKLNSGADFTQATLVQDTKAVAISSNNLAFPDDANVILVSAGTINTVSNVKAGAVYHLVATGSITLTDGSLIVCKGGNVTLATDESVTVIGLESNKISVIS